MDQLALAAGYIVIVCGVVVFLILVMSYCIDRIARYYSLSYTKLRWVLRNERRPTPGIVCYIFSCLTLLSAFVVLSYYYFR